MREYMEETRLRQGSRAHRKSPCATVAFRHDPDRRRIAGMASRTGPRVPQRSARFVSFAIINSSFVGTTSTLGRPGGETISMTRFRT
ncbi:MAG: hypothetical protein RL272_607 [Candidatus Parcubacteria bacterium]